MTNENVLLDKKHILLCDYEFLCFNDGVIHLLDEIKYINDNFCGFVFNDISLFAQYDVSKNADQKQNTILYVCGDFEKIIQYIKEPEHYIIKIIREVSTVNPSMNIDSLISMSNVPILVHKVGVYFRKFFDDDKNFFDAVENEHKFQVLHESNKPSDAFRTGIYLTNVEEENGTSKFHLLRCSTNLDGPTENFRDTDKEIVQKVNNIANLFFVNKVDLNHVLTQIYANKIVHDGTRKEAKKAKISEHSDKTKDMAEDGVMAFCTFYKNYIDGDFCDRKDKQIRKNGHDYHYGKGTVLTKLRFRLKYPEKYPTLEPHFDVTMYPNSLLLIPLTTNRLYTHETIPSLMPVENIPTRMGYVIRCSKTNAIYKDEKTFVVNNDNGELVEMRRPIHEDIKEIKTLYRDENMLDTVIKYGNIYYSLNDGDYKKPIF